MNREFSTFVLRTLRAYKDRYYGTDNKLKAVIEKSARSTLKELPYFSYTGNIIQIHGQFNNSLSTSCKTKRDLDKLTCLYDLD